MKTARLTPLVVSRKTQSFRYDSNINLDGVGQRLYTNIIIPKGSIMGYFIDCQIAPPLSAEWSVGFNSNINAIFTGGVSSTFYINPNGNIRSTGEEVIIDIVAAMGTCLILMHLVYFEVKV